MVAPRELNMQRKSAAESGSAPWSPALLIDLERYPILDLSGDTLRICMAAPGKPRPTDFFSKAGDGRSYTTWRLTKKYAARRGSGPKPPLST